MRNTRVAMLQSHESDGSCALRHTAPVNSIDLSRAKTTHNGSCTSINRRSRSGAKHCRCKGADSCNKQGAFATRQHHRAIHRCGVAAAEYKRHTIKVEFDGIAKGVKQMMARWQPRGLTLPQCPQVNDCCRTPRHQVDDLDRAIFQPTNDAPSAVVARDREEANVADLTKIH